MNSFDSSILLYINGFAGHVRWFDAVMHAFTNNYLFKTIPLVAILCGFWFQEEPNAALALEKRRRILSAFAAAALAPIVARAMAMSLPFRPRPFQEAELHFTLPAYMDPADTQMIDWSAFPSDNVVVMFTLAAGIFACSRRWGVAALILGMLVGFARVYSGLHHPTDAIAGAVLGIACFLIIDHTPIRQWLAKPAFYVMEKYKGLFYALFFLAIDQITHMYADCMGLLNFLFHGVKIH